MDKTKRFQIEELEEKIAPVGATVDGDVNPGPTDDDPTDGNVSTSGDFDASAEVRT